MVMALGPIHTFAGEGTAQSAQRAHINADSAQEAFAVIRQKELISLLAEKVVFRLLSPPGAIA